MTASEKKKPRPVRNDGGDAWYQTLWHFLMRWLDGAP
jgi:hypothetical protein